MQLPDAPATVQPALPTVELIFIVEGAPPPPRTAVTVTDEGPATARGAGGACGAGIWGVTGGDGEDACEVPSALLAVARNVYGVPLLRPSTTHEPERPLTTHVLLPGSAVMAWEVASAPVDASLTVAVADASPGATSAKLGIAGVSIVSIHGRAARTRP